MNFRALVDHETGGSYLPVSKRGDAILHDPFLNKGEAFTRDERRAFGLRGLLPDHVASIEEQLRRVRVQFDLKNTELGKNIYLNGLMDRNETLFYRFIAENLQETVPVIYTPTVASACSHWSRIYRTAHGIYITPRDRGRVAEVLLARPVEQPPVIVVTDNERILGIGDQGAGGMGIPIGKLALYTAAAGIHPARCIPVSIDVGTNNAELLEDPLYIGYRESRLRGEEYSDLVDEFVQAVKEVFPGALLQWEDFANLNSFHNLDTYRKALPSFNDDIQGTAAMVVGGLIAATRRIGGKLTEHRVVIAGSGSAGYGIREQIAHAMEADGLDLEEARSRIHVLDSRGLVVDDRPYLTDVKRRLAVSRDAVADWEDVDDPPSLLDVVENFQPSVLIGVSGIAGLFTEEVVRDVGSHTDRPIVMPLSNPTSHTEVTPANALRWTDGRAIVATGSPFSPVEYDGVVHRIGQANNVFVFPGMGLGVITVRAREVTNRMFLAAAHALADFTSPELLETGQIYPDISDVRTVSRSVAIAVAAEAIAEGLAEPVDDLEAAIDAEMWEPNYIPFRPAGD
ncbi:MAG: NAD-dependent malic enzyme [Actinomycetota bacterium]|nr:NAD-dependent malic enzyme [Actinomycetota bacterium]